MLNQKLSAQKSAAVEDVNAKGMSEEAALRASSDTAGIGRKGLWVLGLGLGGFLLWASVAPLDEGVPTVGVVSIDTKRKAVQHLTGGIVKEVLVHEGEVVQQDQVLMRLDEAVTRANFESVRQRYLGLNAMQSRLQAEQRGASTIQFTPELMAAMVDPYMAKQVNNQRQLFDSRRQALQADLQSMEEAMQGMRAQQDSAQSVMVQRQRQLDILNEELDNIRDLVKDGYAPRNRQLELERMVADVQAALADLNGSIVRASSAIAEMTQRSLARQSEYRKEVESQLADVSREVQADAEKFNAIQADLNRVDIRSPADGQVVSLAVQTVGAVVQPGQKLMDIVPERQVLVLEAQVPPHLIDKVHAGLPTDIRFNTFSQSPQLVVEGKVITVSGDLLSDPANPQIMYFLARLEVTPEGMQTLGSRQMQAGMPAEVVIKTGSRSMLNYMLNPLLKRLAGSMKEE